MPRTLKHPLRYAIALGPHNIGDKWVRTYQCPYCHLTQVLENPPARRATGAHAVMCNGKRIYLASQFRVKHGTRA